MKIAIIHDWLVTYAGAERVLEQIIQCYPDSDLFCVVDFLSEKTRDFLGGKAAKSTFIQLLPFASKKYRSFLPLMPAAIQRLDLGPYDLILSSSHAVAKGVKTRPDQLHISYIHSPMRYAWDLQDQYLRETGLDKGIKGRFIRGLLKRIRDWDFRNTKNIQHIIANSNYIAQRIHNCYGRDSTVIYPPVKVDDFLGAEPKEEFYLTVSRLVPYKKVDLIAAAFREMPDKKLVIVGDGPDFKKVKGFCAPNIQMLGSLPFSEMKELLLKAKAFVFAAEEDFGISVVEAQAAGTPVIAFGRGGALETVRGPDTAGPTGMFFASQEVDSLVDAVNVFEKKSSHFSADACRDNARNFDVAHFRKSFTEFVDSQWGQFQTHPRHSLK